MKDRYLIVGTSRSGKSTLAKKINGVYLDIFDYVEAYLQDANLSQSEPNIELLKKPYEMLCKDLGNGKAWDVLEIASDFPEIFIPKIISLSKPKPTIIFCDCPLSICLDRNLKSLRHVPDNILVAQACYDQEFFQNLAHSLDTKLIVVNTA